MPELPEVQTVADHIKPDLIGKYIVGIEPVWKKVLHNFTPKDLSGKYQIQNVSRRAKFIIIELEDFLLAIHLRMTGKLYLLEQKQRPKHSSAIVYLENSNNLIFEDTRKFGRIYMYKDLSEINSRHGPEPLGKEFTIEWLLTNLKKKKRNIKALLLDQSFISGLGNIYIDEILWESGIHPNSISCAIPKTKVSRLYSAIQNILKEAIRQLGTTFISFSFLNGRSGNYSNELKIFGRQDKPCNICSNAIKKIKVAGRGTHVCTKCQKTHKPKK
jgi:formamidopyrimidine-DNA glycosylase